MCGFIGYRFKNADARELCEPLAEGVQSIRHRGPDDDGQWIGESVGLGFARLSIQDLTDAGHQPMISPDGRHVIVFNGEAYNFGELRADLEAGGEVFHTRTDTEVVLRLYQREGAEMLQRINGMFALAIYDTADDTIFLARDRFGKKPLYLYQNGQILLFGSEIKAMLPFACKLGFDWNLNPGLLYEHLLYRYTAGHDTLIRGVSKCPAGSWIRIDKNGDRQSGRFFDPEAAAGEFAPTSEAEQLDRAAEHLRDSIRLRCISDAPIGVALSGGVDSTLITYLMREVYDAEIRTYSVVFDQKKDGDREIDESRYSDHVAQDCGTTHTRIRLTPEMFSDHYLHCAWLNDEPLNHPHSMGIHLLAKHAAKEVKVLLGGEGADETYAGYNFFAKPFDQLSQSFVRPGDAADLIDAPLDNGYREEIHQRYLGDGINGRISETIRTYLVGILNRLDKMSMGASLEFRTPFLDPRVASYARTLPKTSKVSADSVTKVVLKRLAERYVPADAIYRAKVGFSTPLNEWIRDPNHIGRYVDILSEERTLSRPHFKRAGIENLLAHFRSGTDTFEFSYAGRVWILLNLELWTRMFLEDKRALN